MPCTTILVGQKASNDNSTMIARTDDGHFETKKLIVLEPKDHKKKYKSVISHVEIELPGDPIRCTACPSVNPKNGVWAATGVNAANVGMTATETITTNPACSRRILWSFTKKPKSAAKRTFPAASARRIS